MPRTLVSSKRDVRIKSGHNQTNDLRLLAFCVLDVRFEAFACIWGVEHHDSSPLRGRGEDRGRGKGGDGRGRLRQTRREEKRNRGRRRGRNGESGHDR